MTTAPLQLGQLLNCHFYYRSIDNGTTTFCVRFYYILIAFFSLYLAVNLNIYFARQILTVVADIKSVWDRVNSARWKDFSYAVSIYVHVQSWTVSIHRTINLHLILMQTWHFKRISKLLRCFFYCFFFVIPYSSKLLKFNAVLWHSSKQKNKFSLSFWGQMQGPKIWEWFIKKLITKIASNGWANLGRESDS